MQAAAALMLLATLLPQTAPEAFSHTWFYVGGDAELEGIEQAILEATEEMNVILRPIARSRLRSENRVAESIKIRADASRITVEFSSWDSITTPADGTEASGTYSGREVRVTQRIDGDTLVQRLIESGVRTNALVLGKDGKTMTLQVRIAAGLLTVDVRYSLPYRRR